MTAAALMATMQVAAVAASAAETGLKAYSAYQEGKENARRSKTEAEMQMKQAQAYNLQAADLERQARHEEAKAGIAQIQAEQEAERRSRLLAADIGSAYANFAGNGLLVDGGGKDTVGSVLTTTAAEAARDISTIRDNGRMNVWEHQSNAKSLMTSAETSRISAQSSLLGARSSLKNAKYYRRAGLTSALGELLGGAGQLVKSASSAYGGNS